MVAKRFGVPFRHLPIASKDPVAKLAQEAEIEQILEVGRRVSVCLSVCLLHPF